MLISRAMLFFILVVSLLGLIIIGNCLGSDFPMESMEFYGFAVINGEYAPQGAILIALFADGEKCGEVRLRANGIYRLSCTAPAWRQGNRVFFRLNYDKTNQSIEPEFLPGSGQRVDLWVGTESGDLINNPKVHHPYSASGELLGLVLITAIVVIFINSSLLYSLWKRNK